MHSFSTITMAARLLLLAASSRRAASRVEQKSLLISSLSPCSSSRGSLRAPLSSLLRWHSPAVSRSLSATTSSASPASNTASLSPLAASMLAHVRGTLCLGKPDEAIDVLRTGVVASSSSSSSKLDEAALLLAWSDAEAARCDPLAALERAASAADALSEAAREGHEGSTLSLYLRLLVEDARLRASLALAAPPSAAGADGGGGGGGETLEVESGSPASSSSAVAESSAAGMRALAAHSRGDAETARREAEAAAGALARLEAGERSGERRGEPPAAAAAAATLASLAASRAAAVHLACGEASAAEELYSKAAALAERARRGGSGGDQVALFSPLAAADAALAALSGRAQARASSALPLLPPEAARKDAGDALSSFDSEEGDLCLRRPEAAAAPLLLVLGQICAGSGQVMVAEGLFRRGGQLLGILTSGKAPPARFRDSVHPSVASALAWRHAQLLTALPQRGKEAAELAEAAARIEDSGRPSSSSSSLDSCRSSLEDSLGTLDALTGKGRKGRGVVVDAAARRVLPWLR